MGRQVLVDCLVWSLFDQFLRNVDLLFQVLCSLCIHLLTVIVLVVLRERRKYNLLSWWKKQWSLCKPSDSKDLTENLFQRREKFVCCIFEQRNVSSVNASRFNIFQTTGKFDSILPVYQNSSLLHATRANYQATIWRQCLHNNIIAPSPKNYDWLCEQ